MSTRSPSPPPATNTARASISGGEGERVRSRHRVAPFVEIDVLEKRLHIRPALEAALAQPPLQRRGRFVVPAPLAHELIPYLNLLLARLAALLKSPLERLLIARAALHKCNQRRILDP